jgi:hypothetical protein
MQSLVLPGDGIGPEITEATLKVLHAADAVTALCLTFECGGIGLKSLAEQGTTLPESVAERVSRANGGPGSGEFMPDPDLALSLRKVTARASAHVASAAIGGSLGTAVFADAVCTSLADAPRPGKAARPRRQQLDANR